MWIALGLKVGGVYLNLQYIVVGQDSAAPSTTPTPSGFLSRHVLVLSSLMLSPEKIYR